MNARELSFNMKYDLLFDALMSDIQSLRERGDCERLGDLISVLEGALAFYLITAKDRKEAFSALENLSERLRQALLQYHASSS